MTTDNNTLCIHIPDAADFKNQLLKAIAAAIRWKANYNEHYQGYDFNLYTLAQLQERLVDDE